MVKNFYEDLSKAKKGEAIVLNVLINASNSDDYKYNDVSKEREYFHKGDIECYDANWLCNYYIDVKDDSCVSRTGNILAEHRVWYKNGGWQKGFMQSASYDYVAYLSQPDNTIYMLDFEAWKKNYKSTFKKHLYIPHEGEQTTDGYLMALKDARKLGIVIAEIKYDYDEEKGYYPVEIVA